MGVSTRSWYFIRDKYQFDGRLENNSLRKTSIAQNYVLLILPLTNFFVFTFYCGLFQFLFYFILLYLQLRKNKDQMENFGFIWDTLTEQKPSFPPIKPMQKIQCKETETCPALYNLFPKVHISISNSNKPAFPIPKRFSL